MRVYTSDHHKLELPPNHRFPESKYSKVRKKLVEEKLLNVDCILSAPLVNLKDLELAHCPKYCKDFISGNLDKKIIRKIGLPWSQSLVNRCLSSVGGFLSACNYALENKISGNLSGGTHHARYNEGEGFCVFNDFAIASAKLLKEKKVKNILIIDLDVHQGNGNSELLKDNKNVFVFNMHSEKNYPYRKIASDLDVSLDEGTCDDEYIKQLKNAFLKIPSTKYDIILYQAGVDPLEHDSLGNLNLTFEGLMKRDEIVLTYAYNNNIPIAIAMGGGYSKPIDLSVQAYSNTYRVAKKVYGF